MKGTVLLGLIFGGMTVCADIATLHMCIYPLGNYTWTRAHKCGEYFCTAIPGNWSFFLEREKGDVCLRVYQFSAL
jgi:hypothetical protein